ncbi:MAG: 3-deoxy-manno-octulosonate cytidylyltransferase [Flavobacteriales bacterium]|nr:3-deoxy-manno-octulosonate cytidylyltransferase [Flavobacteriaceae bacterium]RZP00628.1 MAG: 3-deoxy-manno-octulosonate cytidylyltransferase [Flavobacteriales bacterium]|tara:strand:+ start:511 stop:1233 length:723 start_codon:yes stop_codon:yes gene_type:complete
MKVTALIPARLSSTRFDRKLLMDLCGKSIILRTYESVVETGLFHSVYVVTEDQEIYDEIVNAGGNSILSKNKHESGSDRIAEACKSIDSDAFVNIQGDEPFIDSFSLNKLVLELNSSEYVSLMINISDSNEINNPNNVKVIVDSDNYALYFSRSVIPFNRDVNSNEIDYFKHIGVYGFTKQALINFSKLPPSKLELVEKIEAIRIIENGSKIKMIETDFLGVGIDTKEDLDLAISIWSKK